MNSILSCTDSLHAFGSEACVGIGYFESCLPTVIVVSLFAEPKGFQWDPLVTLLERRSVAV